jgi:dTDP-4-dehydrorhamnose reductase
MIRWLVTGAGGMLGTDLLAALRARDPVGVRRQELDVTNLAAVRTVLSHFRPDVVVNCAAWTAVDEAEQREAEAFAVNAVAAANLANVCKELDARLVQVSTDYVFDGDADSPYAEDAPLNPRTSYGRTKAAGEWAVTAILPAKSWIVRTAWLYGAAGANFVRSMIRLEQQRDTIEVVADQQGQPTWSADVARQIVRMVDADVRPGIYHATATGSATWCDLARAVFDELGADATRVLPTTSSKYVRPAPRPRYSVLGHDAWCSAGVPPLPSWRESLAQALGALRNSS